MKSSASPLQCDNRGFCALGYAHYLQRITRTSAIFNVLLQKVDVWPSIDFVKECITLPYEEPRDSLPKFIFHPTGC
ncbi:MAG: hypothetical protein QRY74_02750 [Chlamydia sp.]